MINKNNNIGTYLATGSENGAISVSVVKEWNPIVVSILYSYENYNYNF